MNRFKLLLFFLLISFFITRFSNAFETGNYLAAKHAVSNKDYSAAILFFEKTLDINKVDEKPNQEIAKELCTLYLLEGSIEKCVSIGKKIEKYLNEESASILLALITDDIKRNNLDSALKRLKKVKKHSYERFSIPIINAWIIAVKNKNYKASVDVMSELDKDLHINGLKFLHLALINEFFGKKDEASILYQKSIDTFAEPSFRLIKLAGNAFERFGEIEKAKDLYKTYSKDSNQSLLISDELKRLNANKVPKKEINNLSDAIAELATNIASTFRSDFTNNYSIIYANLALFLKKDFEVAQMFLAELLENEEKFLLANNLYSKISKNSVFDWHAKLRIARNLEILGENSKAISILKQMSNEKKDRHDALKLLGDILRNNKKYVEAIKIYNQALLRVIDIKKDNWDLLYARGMAYERSNQWEKAEKDLLKVLEFLPNQPEVLNYLGYSWIEKGFKMNEAKNLIEKAVNLRPRDPYIVDSLGWAYYKLNEFNKAVVELEKALELKPTDPIINDHLGDAYKESERNIEALYQWKKALYFKPDKELEKKLQLKIKEFTEQPSNTF